MQEVVFLNGEQVEYPMVIVAEPRLRDPREMLACTGPIVMLTGPSVDLWLCEELENGHKLRVRPILSSENVEVKRFICKACRDAGSRHADFCEFA